MGIYLLKMPGFDSQRIIVNGGGNVIAPATQIKNYIKN
jgi:hypothetical protein